MIPNPFRQITQQMYLLQLEWYNIRNYWRVLAKRTKSGLRFDTNRRLVLKWTAKARIILIISLLVHAVIATLLAWLFGVIFFGSIIIFLILEVLLLYGLSLLYYLILPIVVALLWPLDHFLKKRVIKRATAKLARRSDVKVVAVTGSYGKSTIKEALVKVLGTKYKVVATPENKNMPLGLSKLILDQLTDETEVLIVEMGAFWPGDIKELCQIAPPDIAILSGINEAHLKQFGSLENTIKTKFEIVANAKPGALAVFNADSLAITDNYKQHLAGREVNFYSNEPHEETLLKLKEKQFAEDGFGISFRLVGPEEEEYNFKMPHLAEYIIGTMACVTTVARHLGLSREQIEKGALAIKPVAHRLEPIKAAGGVTVIDDSYNGNPDGVREAINVLKRVKGERKLYLTPGLVEGGERTEIIHKSIGKQLAPVADVVLLIRNSVTPHIDAGLTEAGFSGKVIWYDTAPLAHAALKEVLKQGDVIVFQNDWPDNYF